MQRFWNDATATLSGGVYRILLDGKPMRLPSGGILLIENATLAQAIAAEWQLAGGQKGGTMSYTDVPLTALAGTAQERIAADPAPTIAALAKYGASDLLCYRASEPDELVRRQTLTWQPWLDWAAEHLGARLAVTQGVMPVQQDAHALARLAGAVSAQPAAMLAALSIVVPALGSLVLGLAMASFRLAAQTAYEIASLDELFQAELWGEDAAASSRRKAIAADIMLAERFMALSSGGSA